MMIIITIISSTFHHHHHLHRLHSHHFPKQLMQGGVSTLSTPTAKSVTPFFKDKQIKSSSSSSLSPQQYQHQYQQHHHQQNQNHCCVKNHKFPQKSINSHSFAEKRWKRFPPRSQNKFSDSSCCCCRLRYYSTFFDRQSFPVNLQYSIFGEWGGGWVAQRVARKKIPNTRMK